jgi:adenylate kinase
MKLIIMGPQGSGKGTYASRLSTIFGMPHISTGQIFRDNIAQGTPLGKEVDKFLKSGVLVPDDITLETVKNRLSEPDCKKGFIFDGFPRTLKQAEGLEKITKLDYVINLVVPDWVLIKRLSLRVTCEKCGEIYNLGYLKPKIEGICDKCGGRLIQRDDDKEEAIKKRLREYEEKTKPLIDYYKNKGILLNIFNDKIETPPEIVVDKILVALGVKK